MTNAASSPDRAAVTPGGPVHQYEPVGTCSIVKRSVGSFDNNVYLIQSGDEALIVDGAAEPDLILAMASALRATGRVVGIVQTHNHPDHVQALRALVEALGCPVYAHPSDQMPVPCEPLKDGMTLSVGDLSVKVIHTPGHTPGSTCYVIPGFVFSGDALFPGGPGNTDGDPARFAQAMDAIEGPLMSLPDSTRICPGYGADSFIGVERPQVAEWRARGW